MRHYYVHDYAPRQTCIVYSALTCVCLPRAQNSYTVSVYEITRTVARRARVAELRAPGAVLSVQLCGGRLLLGYRGGFVAHCLPDPRRAADQPALCEYIMSSLLLTYTSLTTLSGPNMSICSFYLRQSNATFCTRLYI